MSNEELAAAQREIAECRRIIALDTETVNKLAARVTELEAVIEQVVKRTPFVASATGITLEMPFATIKLLQDALKGRA